MKRNLIVILSSIVLILALIAVPVLAKENQNNGTPFQELWDVINNLQQQVDGFTSQSGPTQEAFDALASRVLELEAVIFNQPPTFTSDPVLSVSEDASYTYNIVTHDPDPGSEITITANLLPSWLALTDHGDGTATLTGTPTNEHVGNHSVILQAVDNISDSTIQSFVITVVNSNDAPVFTSEPEILIPEDFPYTYYIFASDIDVGDELTITAITLPGWLSFTDQGDGTATLAGTPENEDVGGHDVELQVSDGSEINTQEFTITVININDSPIICDLDTHHTALIDSTFTLDISAFDPDGDELEIMIETSGALLAWLTLTDHGDGTATLTCSPGVGDVGIYEITVFACDSFVNSIPVLITIYVY